jgi:hypothetical protein
VGVRGRLATDDPSTAVAACVAGQGVFQSLEMGLGSWLKSGELVQILSDWSEERYPLYAYHPSRHPPPAKVRAFLDFVQEIATDEAAPSVKRTKRSEARSAAVTAARDRPVKATNFSGSNYFRGFSRQRLREKRPLAQRLIRSLKLHLAVCSRLRRPPALVPVTSSICRRRPSIKRVAFMFRTPARFPPPRKPSRKLNRSSLLSCTTAPSSRRWSSA